MNPTKSRFTLGAAVQRFFIIVALCSLVPTVTRAGMVAEFTGIGQGPAGVPGVSIGWSFTTNGAISVTALDALDQFGSGNWPVRIYDGSGNIQASANATLFDPTEGSGVGTFFTHAITPVTLAANSTYYIAMDTGSGTNITWQNTGLTTSPLINFGQGVWANGNTLNPTTDAGPVAPAGAGYFGPNFDAVAAPTSEPSTFVLGIAAMAGMGFVALRKKYRRA